MLSSILYLLPVNVMDPYQDFKNVYFHSVARVMNEDQALGFQLRDESIKNLSLPLMPIFWSQVLMKVLVKELKFNDLDKVSFEGLQRCFNTAYLTLGEKFIHALAFNMIEHNTLMEEYTRYRSSMLEQIQVFEDLIYYYQGWNFINLLNIKDGWSNAILFWYEGERAGDIQCSLSIAVAQHYGLGCTVNPLQSQHRLANYINLTGDPRGIVIKCRLQHAYNITDYNMVKDKDPDLLSYVGWNNPFYYRPNMDTRRRLADTGRYLYIRSLLDYTKGNYNLLPREERERYESKLTEAEIDPFTLMNLLICYIDSNNRMTSIPIRLTNDCSVS
jgi:hypothetical protein